ncbi:MAG: hypothetical protein PHZ22_03230 [Bacteroidales bacterium]|nr:hypothetical protein [Bacteroidales bacterium]
MENNLQKSLWVTLLILAVLVILYFVPPIRLANTTLRRVDLLSDLRGDSDNTPDGNHAVRDSAAIGISKSSIENTDNEPVMDDSYEAEFVAEDTLAVAEHQKIEEEAVNTVEMAKTDTTTEAGKAVLAQAQANLDTARAALAKVKADLADAQASNAKMRAAIAKHKRAIAKHREEMAQRRAGNANSQYDAENSQYMAAASTTQIIDYGGGSSNGMGSFYAALNNAGSRPVRIAVFGDSFIEADILTVNLREMFQRKYGGCGVGFVNINALADAPRPTVKQKSDGFTDHSAMDIKGYDRTKLGISGHYAEPENGAYVFLRGQKKFASHLDTCSRSTIYFTSKYGAKISAKINNATEQFFNVPASGAMQTLHVDGRIGSVKWIVNQANKSVFYGVSMDGSNGVTVDNFSLRGSSGTRIHAVPYRTLASFNSVRHYDLIILEFGLNVASPGSKNYVWYESGFLKTISYLKKCFPNTSILLLGVSDRGHRMEDGSIRTMPGIKLLLDTQNIMAKKSGIAFWNTFEAMGGEGSMVKMVENKPPLANLDYTHINYRGGKMIAKKLFNALMEGK